jgi:hypothetical protein
MNVVISLKILKISDHTQLTQIYAVLKETVALDGS